MRYHYLYQDKRNQNCEGDVEARNRAEAYARLRKDGIRPYRLIGDDPFDWRPLLFWAAMLITVISMIVAVGSVLMTKEARLRGRPTLTEEEAAVFRLRAQDAVERAPLPYRYTVWKGVNARLEERGLEPIPKPEGLSERDAMDLTP